MRFALALSLLALPAFADGCPPSKDFSAELGSLIEAARAAPDERTGRAISDQMWQIYMRAPDEQAQAVLDAGLTRRNAHDFLGALAAFDRLVSYCPDYAEGYNQRAFVNYLRGDWPTALEDLDRALQLSPDHLGAQSGRALTLMQLDRIPEARAQMLEALETNPWLSERFLLAPGGPLDLPGKDI